MISCSWKETFGVQCPACGAQRSFTHLVQGHFWEALQQFPAIIPLFVAFLAFTTLLLPVNWPMKLTAVKILPFSFLVAASMMFQVWLFRLFGLDGAAAWTAGGFFYLLILFLGIKITFTNKLKLL